MDREDIVVPVGEEGDALKKFRKESESQESYGRLKSRLNVPISCLSNDMVGFLEITPRAKRKCLRYILNRNVIIGLLAKSSYF